MIDRGRVFAISHSGRMVAIDLRTGDRVWEQEIGGTQAPWVAGDYIYRARQRQRADLPDRATTAGCAGCTSCRAIENPKKKKDPICWAGPVLGGDRLIVVGSNGEALSVSPYTGAAARAQSTLPDGVFSVRSSPATRSTS